MHHLDGYRIVDDDGLSVSSADSGYDKASTTSLSSDGTPTYASYRKYLDSYGKKEFRSVRPPKPEANLKSEIFINLANSDQTDHKPHEINITINLNGDSPKVDRNECLVVKPIETGFVAKMSKNVFNAKPQAAQQIRKDSKPTPHLAPPIQRVKIEESAKPPTQRVIVEERIKQNNTPMQQECVKQPIPKFTPTIPQVKLEECLKQNNIPIPNISQPIQRVLIEECVKQNNVPTVAPPMQHGANEEIVKQDNIPPPPPPPMMINQPAVKIHHSLSAPKVPKSPNKTRTDELKDSVINEIKTFGRSSLRKRSEAYVPQNSYQFTRSFANEPRNNYNTLPKGWKAESPRAPKPDATADNDKNANKEDPSVKKLVYNAYRNMLGAYNGKANTFIATLPRNMVVEDKGIREQLESIALQGGLDHLNGRVKEASDVNN